MEYNSILVRYDEIALKGRNRYRFEKRLTENIANVLHKDASNKFKIEREHGRILVRGERLNPYALKNVLGITSISPAIEIQNTPEAIIEKASEIAKREWRNIIEVTGDEKRFRITAQRGLKSFPKTSMEIEAEVGSEIQASFPSLKVDLKDYDLELGIDVRTSSSFIFTERIPGFRGLPIGTNGRLISLLSGGIDSPVAAWMMMKRGCPITFVHFHAAPYTGPAIKQKISELVNTLKKFQNKTKLYFVPFAEIQMVIKENAPEKYRTILYRRIMHRIAEGIRIQESAFGLVTGDSIGQVSSQTVENMKSIMDAVQSPIFQPLIGMDKLEIIERAKKIGTFEISIQNAPDCCTLFTPKFPATKSHVDKVREVERTLNIVSLIEGLLSSSEMVIL